MLGGLIIGMLKAFSNQYLAAQWTRAFIFAILILVLVFRPQGLLGQGEAEKHDGTDTHLPWDSPWPIHRHPPPGADQQLGAGLRGGSLHTHRPDPSLIHQWGSLGWAAFGLGALMAFLAYGWYTGKAGAYPMLAIFYAFSFVSLLRAAALAFLSAQPLFTALIFLVLAYLATGAFARKERARPSP